LNQAHILTKRTKEEEEEKQKLLEEEEKTQNLGRETATQ
jgi:hypothetical protein